MAAKRKKELRKTACFGKNEKGRDDFLVILSYLLTTKFANIELNVVRKYALAHT